MKWSDCRLKYTVFTQYQSVWSSQFYIAAFSTAAASEEFGAAWALECTIPIEHQHVCLQNRGAHWTKNVSHNATSSTAPCTFPRRRWTWKNVPHADSVLRDACARTPTRNAKKKQNKPKHQQSECKKKQTLSRLSDIWLVYLWYIQVSHHNSVREQFYYSHLDHSRLVYRRMLQWRHQGFVLLLSRRQRTCCSVPARIIRITPHIKGFGLPWSSARLLFAVSHHVYNVILLNRDTDTYSLCYLHIQNLKLITKPICYEP